VSRRACLTPTVQAGRFSWSATNANTSGTALDLDDPVEALRQVTMAGTGIWAIDTGLVRNLFSLARAQPEALPVIAQLEAGRLGAMEHLAGRLHQVGRLRSGLARDRAVDLLLVISAFAAWDELLTVRNRSPADATATIADLAIRAVVSD
jgi:hypothetical protein